jgi:hypothetical protein
VSQFAPEDSQGSIDLVSNGDITFEADRDQDGAGDLVFRTGGVERARIKHDGSGTGWPNVLGGSISYVHPSGGDDAALLGAALPDVGLRASASYLIPNGWTIAGQAIIEGRGMGAPLQSGTFWQDALSSLSCATDGTDGVTLTAAGTYCDKFGVVCTVAAPTGGAGFHWNGAHGFRARDISSKGFYYGARVESSTTYVLDGFLIVDPQQYGLYIGGSDNGDGVVSNGYIYTNSKAPTSAIRWEGGGGVKFEHVKVNQLQGNAWTNGIDIHALAATNTGELSFADCIIDWCSYGVLVNCDAGGTLQELRFCDCSIKGSHILTNGYLVRSAGNQIVGLEIKGGLVKMAPSSSTGVGSAFDIDNVDSVTIDGVDVIGVAAGVPIVKLGANVNAAVVRLGTIRATRSSKSYANGASVILLEMDGGGHNIAYGGGAGVSQFTATMPSQTIAKAAFTNIWTVDVNSGAAVDITLNAIYNSGGVYRNVIQRRSLRRTGPGTASIATIGTDFADPASEVDIQWTVSGSTVTIAAQIDAASAASSMTGYSTLGVVGLPKTITAVVGA